MYFWILCWLLCCRSTICLLVIICILGAISSCAYNCIRESAPPDNQMIFKWYFVVLIMDIKFFHGLDMVWDLLWNLPNIIQVWFEYLDVVWIWLYYSANRESPPPISQSYQGDIQAITNIFPLFFLWLWLRYHSDMTWI